MKSTITNFVMILSIGAGGLAATSALAGGLKISVGHSEFHGDHHHKHHHHHHGHHRHNYHHRVYVKPVYVKPVVVQPSCYPFHSSCFVYPGDTWLTLSQREFGNTKFGSSIAAYNGLNMSMPLVVGQQLRLPVIHPGGALTASNAPAPAPFFLPNSPPATEVTNAAAIVSPISAPQGQPAAPSASVRTVSDESSLPKVAIGSTLVLDGQELDNDRGTVRLRINGVSLPVEVLDWSTSSAKIRLPEMELSGAMKADIEVLRADGSLASKSAIELTPAVSRLALGK
jgi:hypothetical protein